MHGTRSKVQIRQKIGSPVAARPAGASGNFKGRASAADLAARAIAGVKAGRLYIATHPECRRLHEDRYNELIAAYDAAGAWKAHEIDPS